MGKVGLLTTSFFLKWFLRAHFSALGYWRTTEVPKHVGEILSWSQCHRVSQTLPKDLLITLNGQISKQLGGFCSYMVDAADHEKIEASRNELHNLLDKPQLAGIPVLVLGNKRDIVAALDEKELIEKMWDQPWPSVVNRNRIWTTIDHVSLSRSLNAIQDREICCYSISCKEKDNIGRLSYSIF